MRAIRNPFVPVKALRAAQFKHRRELWKRYGQVRLLNGFSRQFRQHMKRSGLLTPDGVIGVIETGTYDNPNDNPKDNPKENSGYRSLPARRWPACRKERGSSYAIPDITTTTCAPPAHACLLRARRSGDC